MRRANRALAIVTFAVLSARPALADCQGAGNLIQSCGFATAADTVDATSPWTLSGAGIFGTYSHDAADGSSAVGSLIGVTTADSTEQRVLFFQCVVAPAAGTYGYGIDIRHSAPDAAFVQCALTIRTHATSDCSGSGTMVNDVFTTAFTGNWQQLSDVGTVIPAATASAKFEVHCFRATTVVAGTFRFDDAFFGIGLVPVDLQSFEVK
jgi:hypothetical protein